MLFRHFLAWGSLLSLAISTLAQAQPAASYNLWQPLISTENWSFQTGNAPAKYGTAAQFSASFNHPYFKGQGVADGIFDTISFGSFSTPIAVAMEAYLAPKNGNPLLLANIGGGVPLGNPLDSAIWASDGGCTSGMCPTTGNQLNFNRTMKANPVPGTLIPGGGWSQKAYEALNANHFNGGQKSSEYACREAIEANLMNSGGLVGPVVIKPGADITYLSSASSNPIFAAFQAKRAQELGENVSLGGIVSDFEGKTYLQNPAPSGLYDKTFEVQIGFPLKHNDPVCDPVASPFGGTGPQGEHLICSWQHIKNISNLSNGAQGQKFVLASDLGAFTQSTTTNPANKNMVNFPNGTCFKGHFDGNHHQIGKLQIQTQTSISNPISQVGMFERICGTVENLKLKVEIAYNGSTGSNYGGLGGVCQSCTIKNVHVHGGVSGQNDTGLLFGRIEINPLTPGVPAQILDTSVNGAAGSTASQSSNAGLVAGVVVGQGFPSVKHVFRNVSASSGIVTFSGMTFLGMAIAHQNTGGIGGNMVHADMQNVVAAPAYTYRLSGASCVPSQGVVGFSINPNSNIANHVWYLSSGAFSLANDLPHQDASASSSVPFPGNVYGAAAGVQAATTSTLNWFNDVNSTNFLTNAAPVTLGGPGGGPVTSNRLHINPTTIELTVHPCNQSLYGWIN